MRKTVRNAYPYFPIIGLGFYVMIFFAAALKYPGGSINEPHASGYSFFNNFLCDVMNPEVRGGQQNAARGLAIFGHWILSLSMISFFYLLPEIFPVRNRNTRLVRIFGMLTMTVFILMCTPYHDLIVTLTAILGTIALIPFFIELRSYGDRGFVILAYLCFVLSIIVYFIFKTKIGFYYLPFLQKITFGFDAWWVIWVSLKVLQRHHASNFPMVSESP